MTRCLHPKQCMSREQCSFTGKCLRDSTPPPVPPDPAVEACVRDAIDDVLQYDEDSYSRHIESAVTKAAARIRALRPPEPTPPGGPGRTIYQVYVGHGCWEKPPNGTKIVENDDGSLSCSNEGGRSTFKPGAWRAGLLPVAGAPPGGLMPALLEAQKWLKDIATLPREGCTECDDITTTHAIKTAEHALACLTAAIERDRECRGTP